MSKYRTLAADGASEPFDTRPAARKHAKDVSSQTGDWCGVQERSAASDSGWALVDVFEATPDPRQPK